MAKLTLRDLEAMRQHYGIAQEEQRLQPTPPVLLTVGAPMPCWRTWSG